MSNNTVKPEHDHRPRGLWARLSRFSARLKRKFPHYKIKLRMFLNDKGLRRERKVFAIGFNKSATTSMHELFKSLGRPSFHQGDGSKGRWRPAESIELLQSYDCFSDGPPRVGELEKLDGMFPSAKYILQVRALEDWIYSRFAHNERRIAKRPWENRQPDTPVKVKEWIVQRNRYHSHVFDYFSSRPDDLLVVNFIRDADATKKICRFAGYPVTESRPHAHSNPIRERPAHQTAMLQQSLIDLGIPEEELGHDLLCPSLLNEEDREKYPKDTSLLS